MKRFARALTATLGLIVLGSTVSLVSQKPAAGAGGAPVTIMNPLPLPVIGSVSITGTPSVNVSNIPSVTVSNNPTVSLASGSNVNVSNPLDASSNPTPLATLDASQPYEDNCFASFAGSDGGFCDFRTIPAGKRLVIQEFDASIILIPQGLRPVHIGLNATSRDHAFTDIFMGSSGTISDAFATHQETRIYAGPNQTPRCGVTLSGAASGANLSCALSGFLVDVSVL